MRLREALGDTMDSLLPKACLLAVIAAGFAFTGDLNWVADRGLRVLGATEVGRSTATSEVFPPTASKPPTATPRGLRSEPVAVGTAARPPVAGLDTVAWTTLEAGDRVVVWFGGRSRRCLALDVVDPAAGEVLAYEVATVSEQGRPLTAATPPTRVIVGRPAAGRPPAGFATGGMIHVAPAGIAAAGEDGRWLGPIESLTVAR